jgi:hypothetical protein
MDIQSLKTLTGKAFADLKDLLDAELPEDAYSPVPGGAKLTDIDPGYMRKTLNEVFGPCGLGWGYSYSSVDASAEVEERQTNNGKRRVYVVSVKKLTFWYKLVDENGNETVAEIPSSGGSENSVEGFAYSGAITNAIGKAVSNIGFQESVYLGKRSHLTVGKKPATPAKPAPKPAAPATKAPAPKPDAKPADDEIVDETPATPVAEEKGSFNDPASFVITIGQRKGQALGEQDTKLVEWYASSLKPSTSDAKELQAAAQNLLKIRTNGKPVAA